MLNKMPEKDRSNHIYSLGLDLGSSSIKASILDLDNGRIIASDFYPKKEMGIKVPREGWAEQDPKEWWDYIKVLIKQLTRKASVDGKALKFIGISYQMHGLVLIDRDGKVLRPAIIWCDSRAVETGKKALEDLGEGILKDLLNTPGNFTASKLKWVMDNEPGIFEKTYKFMLPGDYIAFKFTGRICTTKSGLSEGIFWDFNKDDIYMPLLEYYGIPESLFPEIVGTFSSQGTIRPGVADELGLPPDAIVSYRAGDQPNNALSLNVFNAGEVAATAGTSGVVYGISDEVRYDPRSRVNTFAHVNHDKDHTRLGVLLNINGTGIMNSWIQKNVTAGMSYEQMNELASTVPHGSVGLIVFPFGNGAERMFENKNTGAGFLNLNLNIHKQAHMIRASQEAIAFSFSYGMKIMESTGINTSVIRAGYNNMFLSDVFSQTLADISGAIIELYETDGSQGAARAAAFGGGFYKTTDKAFSGLRHIRTIEPKPDPLLFKAYDQWSAHLQHLLKFR